MSARNGNKSRHHRERKQKIARRKQIRERLRPQPPQSKSVKSSAATATRSVPA